jgi:hypothetical protein
VAACGFVANSIASYATMPSAHGPSSVGVAGQRSPLAPAARNASPVSKS